MLTMLTMPSCLWSGPHCNIGTKLAIHGFSRKVVNCPIEYGAVCFVAGTGMQNTRVRRMTSHPNDYTHQPAVRRGGYHYCFLLRVFALQIKLTFASIYTQHHQWACLPPSFKTRLNICLRSDGQREARLTRDIAS